jgi:hypothetical protein
MAPEVLAALFHPTQHWYSMWSYSALTKVLSLLNTQKPSDMRSLF